LIDYRSGALGRISLETPVLRAERETQLAALAAAAAAADAEKA
jgi:ribosome biogenesis GTPase A